MKLEATIKDGLLSDKTRKELIAPSEKEKLDDWTQFFRELLQDCTFRGDDLCITIERKRRPTNYTI